MITGFYYFRRWFKRIENIDEPMLYSDESCEYLDSLWTYATSRGINPDTLVRAVES